MKQRRDIFSCHPDQETILIGFYFKITKRFDRRLCQHDATIYGKIGYRTWRLKAALDRFKDQCPPICGKTDIILSIEDDTRGWDDCNQICINILIHREDLHTHTIAQLRAALCQHLEAECKARTE